MYADYAFYKDVYKGSKLTEEEFERLCTRASDLLDYLTAGEVRGKADDPSVKKAACAVAELWQKEEDGGRILAESVGSWSQTFANGGSAATDIMEAARMYLIPLGIPVGWGWT